LKYTLAVAPLPRDKDGVPMGTQRTILIIHEGILDKWREIGDLIVIRRREGDKESTGNRLESKVGKGREG